MSKSLYDEYSALEKNVDMEFYLYRNPAGYEKYSANENKILLIFERVGETSVTCCALIFSNFNIGKISPWSLWLFAVCVLMIFYELYWVKYFKSEKTMSDLYRSFWGILVAGATLPVAAFLLMGVYGKNIFMIISVTILGIGHIGIHLGHRKEII